MVKAKKNLSEFAQQKRAWKDKKQLNPFEIHINREKQKVLGRKNKNDRGLPGISRAKAINKRKQSLLQEYKLQNKDNVFLDKRIGERDSAMSVEDKAMARFARQLRKTHKRNIYNLNDDEILTHRGHTLEEIEKFDDPKSEDEFSDEEKSGKLDKNFVEGAHFGGGLLSKPDTALSRKDLIDQLIAESKKRKAEKQKIREQTIDLTEKLDSEWKDLLPLMSASKKTDEDAAETTKADVYDITVRELKFEARGNPSDKLKSEEEIVQEEKERLEALEADRLARMKGRVSETNDKPKHRSADDLDDRYLVETIADDAEDADDNIDDNTVANDSEDRHQDEVCSNSSNAEDRSDSESNSEDVADEDSEDNFSDLQESESSSEDEDKAAKKRVMFSNGLTKEIKETKQHDVICPKSILKQNKADTQNSSGKDKQQEIINDLLRRKEVMEKARKELPYAYNVPESFEELKKLLETQTSEYQSIIVDRILKCNHWTLDTKNKEELSNLFVYLLQYIHDCASVDDADDLVRCFQIFDR